MVLNELAEQPHSTCVFAGADQLNWVAAAATVSSVLHHAFEYFHWTVRELLMAVSTSIMPRKF
jgi:predicted branched-subunit amino acid permease